MAKECMLCGAKTIFYIWSTSRNFPKHKFHEYLDKHGNMNRDFVVCFNCYHSLTNGEE